jgi:Mrp family chromosome partitioning ATPase
MSLIEQAMAKMQASRTREVVAPEKKPERAPIELGGAPPKPGSTMQLPYADLRLRGILPPEHQDRELADQYRTIKRPLLAAAFEQAAERGPLSRSLIITSSVPGEGKTFTSLNLVMNMALERDYTVVLIDGDVAKGELTEAMGHANRPGLLDVLASTSTSLESCMVGIERPRMMFVPAGERRAGAPELLSSARMRSVFTEFLERHPSCFLIFDSPPLLLTSEAQSLLSVAGQVLLVVHSGTTTRKDVLDSVAAIGPAPSVSLLLNQVPYHSEQPRYGYGAQPQPQAE